MTSSPSLPSRRLSREIVGSGVEVLDFAESRIRRSGDMIGTISSLLAIVAILIFSVYAPATTVGITEDVQEITNVVQALRDVALSFLENVVDTVVPIAVIGTILWRRQIRLGLEALGASVVGIAMGYGVSALLEWDVMSSTRLLRSLTITTGHATVAAIVPIAVGISALLTAAGPRSRRKVVSVSWNLYWAYLIVQVIAGVATLTGALITALLGRAIGQIIRYVFGVTTDRAYGKRLVDGISEAGIAPVRVVRVRDISNAESPTIKLDVSGLRTGEPPPTTEALPASDAAALALERQAGNRVYAVYDAEGRRWDCVVLDGDKQVIGTLTRTWRALRLRGMDRRAVVSLRQAAERAALLYYAAAAAGVRTPKMIGIGEAEDSMMLLQSHPEALRPIRDMPAGHMTDTVLDSVWEQLKKAHDAGLAHRAITTDTVLFGPFDGEGYPVWLTGWDNGDIASSELARRLDLVQLLAVLALRVGATRAVASAERSLGTDELRAVTPLLQSIALPSQTRQEAAENPDVLDDLRSALLSRIPEGIGESFQLVRFGWRTILIATIAVIAAWVVVTTLNIDGIVSAISKANPAWIIVAFAAGLVNYVGAAGAMLAFTPNKLRFSDTLLTQVAASFVGLAAPGGIGPAALNLRLLTKRGVKTSLALATVSLVQVWLFITTIVMLLILALATGETSLIPSVPSFAIIIIVVLILIVAALLTVGPVRRWLWEKTGPTLSQVWPRIVWVLGKPRRLILGTAANILQTASFVFAFWASLQAFGVGNISLVNIALVYLLGNTAGSAVPTPGGLGAVEGAFTVGLKSVGLSSALAASASVLFRVVTYWGRVPLGWIAWRYLQRKDVL